MRYKRKNKIKKKETTSIFFNMRGIYGNENNTQVNSYAIYTKTYWKKEVVSYASITQTHKKEMTCHKVTNLRTEA